MFAVACVGVCDSGGGADHIRGAHILHMPAAAQV